MISSPRSLSIQVPRSGRLGVLEPEIMENLYGVRAFRRLDVNLKPTSPNAKLLLFEAGLYAARLTSR